MCWATRLLSNRPMLAPSGPLPDRYCHTGTLPLINLWRSTVMPTLSHLISPYSVRSVELWFAQAQWHRWKLYALHNKRKAIEQNWCSVLLQRTLWTNATLQDIQALTEQLPRNALCWLLYFVSKGNHLTDSWRWSFYSFYSETEPIVLCLCFIEFYFDKGS